MKTSSKIYWAIAVAAASIGCDRVTKNLAKEYLKDNPPLVYLNNFFRLEYAENTGAALGFGDSLPPTASFWLFSILPLCFLAVMFVYMIMHAGKMGFMKVLSLALIFAGGIGNITDRILYDRHVTDFMNMGIGSLRTGIFNVADVCVTSGAIGLLLFFRRQEKAV